MGLDGWQAHPPGSLMCPVPEQAVALNHCPDHRLQALKQVAQGGKDVERKKAIILHLMLGMEILITAKLSSSCINSHFLTESSSLGLVSVATDVQPYLPSDIIISYSSVGFPH